VAVIQQRSVLPKPKRPLSSPKPPAFIDKPRGRYHYLPFGAFSIDDLALIKSISADLDPPAFISAYTNGRSTLQAGSPSDLLILPKPIPFQILPRDGFFTTP
jgi:hypothetical protein